MNDNNIMKSFITGLSQERKNIIKHIIILSILVLVAYSLYLFNMDYYWDDFALVGHVDWQKETGNSVGRLYFRLLSLFNQLGYNWSYPLLLVKVVAVLSLLAVGVSVYLMSIRNSFLKRYAFFIAAFSAVMPIYPCIYASICTMNNLYALGFFFFAFWLQTLHTERRFSRFKHGRSIDVAAVLFSMIYYTKSFGLPAFYVFYALPFIYNFYLFFRREAKKDESILFQTLKSVPKIFFLYCVKNIEFLLLPFVMFVINKKFFPVTGIYAATEYNKIRLTNILHISNLFIIQCKKLLDGYLDFYLLPHNIKKILKLFVLLLIVETWLRIKNKKLKRDICYYIVLILTSVVLMVLASFAYLAVGKIGNFDDVWETRHLMLLALPVALLLVAFISCLCYSGDKASLKCEKIIFVLPLLLFISNNLRVGFRFYREQLKQDNIVALFKKSDLIRNNQIFLFYENGLKTILRGHYRRYETSGMAWKAYGTRNHLIVSADTYVDLIKDASRCEQSLIESYTTKDQGDGKISDIDHYTLDGNILYKCGVTRKDAIKCMVYQIFNRSKYWKTVESLGELTVTLVNGAQETVGSVH